MTRLNEKIDELKSLIDMKMEDLSKKTSPNMLDKRSYVTEYIFYIELSGIQTSRWTHTWIFFWFLSRTVAMEMEPISSSMLIDLLFLCMGLLEYDILEYVVIEWLVQGGREKLENDGLNLSDWLQSLA
ncbi:THO complex subunit 2 [Artemisia annua]|uniref:THO complex subunit 2 n=1 Tax=Artemisia annua TaxID=35608 RepID=A0A2U1M0W7_ARTAN|nr:THO complex subunit 2 [Artemisia annua]